MDITLTYNTNYFPFRWTLNVCNGLGLQVDFSAKPTKKQIRNVVNAVIKADHTSWGKKYSIVKGKMI